MVEQISKTWKEICLQSETSLNYFSFFRSELWSKQNKQKFNAVTLSLALREQADSLILLINSLQT